MKRSGGIVYTALLVISDLGLVALAFYLAYWLRQAIAIPPPVNIAPFRTYLGMMFIQVATMGTAFFFGRLYGLPRSFSRLDEFYRIFATSSIGMLATTALTLFLFKNSTLELDFPRVMVIYAWILTVALVTAGRALLAVLRDLLRKRGHWADRMLIVGTGEVGRMILQKIRQTPGLGYRVVGFAESNGSAVQEVMGVPVLGSVEELPDLIRDHNVREVIICRPDLSHQELLSIVSRCEGGQVAIKIFPDLFQIIATEVTIDDLGGLPLLSVRDVALRGWRLTLKRSLDLIGSTVGLVVLSPFLLLVALAIKLDSRGPVFYPQERMGLDARPFWCLKFRSMQTDAEKNGPGWTRENDPRVTRLGRLMRRFSIDELPQLINVLLGEMSLVGPRPERPVYVEQFRQRIPRYMDRHREKAGLTGWAQVNGLRGDTSIAERTKYDLWYIENWSVWLDIKILVRTVVNALGRDPNAY